MTKKLDPIVKIENARRREEERKRLASEKAAVRSAKQIATDKIKENQKDSKDEAKRAAKESAERVEAAARAKNVEDAILAVKAVKDRQDKKRAAENKAGKTPAPPRATRPRGPNGKFAKAPPAPPTLPPAPPPVAAPSAPTAPPASTGRVRQPKAGAPDSEMRAKPLNAEQQALLEQIAPNRPARPDMSQWTPEERQNYRKRMLLDRHFERETRRKLKEDGRRPQEQTPTGMSYERARILKTIKFTDLAAKRIAEGGGIFESMGGAFSEKFRGRAKRGKAMFDPMNIIKKLTFGSNLAPALYGRMMGRSKEDIDFFSRKRNKRGNYAKDPMYTTVTPGRLSLVRSSDGLADILAKLFILLKKEQDEKTLLREIQNSFRKVESLKEEKRHNDILAALRARNGYAKTTTVTSSTPVDDNRGLFTKILDFMKGLVIGAAKRILGYVMKIYSFFKKIYDSVRGFGKVLSAMKWLARLRPFAALAPLAVMYLVTKWARDAEMFSKTGELSTTGKVLDTISKSVGGNGMTPDTEKSNARKILEEPKSAGKRWKERIGLGVELSQTEAAAVKTRHDIDWPKELIKKEQTSDRDALKARKDFSEVDPRLKPNFNPKNTAYSVGDSPVENKAQRLEKTAVHMKKAEVAPIAEAYQFVATPPASQATYNLSSTNKILNVEKRSMGPGSQPIVIKGGKSSVEKEKPVNDIPASQRDKTNSFEEATRRLRPRI